MNPERSEARLNDMKRAMQQRDRGYGNINHDRRQLKNLSELADFVPELVAEVESLRLPADMSNAIARMLVKVDADRQLRHDVGDEITERIWRWFAEHGLKYGEPVEVTAT